MTPSGIEPATLWLVARLTYVLELIQEKCCNILWGKYILGKSYGRILKKKFSPGTYAIDHVVL